MNKFKVNDKVILNEKSLTWHVDHLVDCYTVPSELRKFPKYSYEEVAALLLAKANRSKLRGVVIGYGAQDDDFKDKRNFVKVDFNYKGLKVDFYCSEKDIRGA